MRGNPYIGMLESIISAACEKQTTWGGIIGKVISVTPFSISCMGLTLDGDDMLINPDMLRSDAESPLSAGDRVLMIPSANKQEFYICCKLEAIN